MTTLSIMIFSIINLIVTLSIIALGKDIKSLYVFIFLYVCQYAECRNAECHNAGSHGANNLGGTLARCNSTVGLTVNSEEAGRGSWWCLFVGDEEKKFYNIDNSGQCYKKLFANYKFS